MRLLPTAARLLAVAKQIHELGYEVALGAQGQETGAGAAAQVHELSLVAVGGGLNIGPESGGRGGSHLGLFETRFAKVQFLLLSIGRFRVHQILPA